MAIDGCSFADYKRLADDTGDLGSHRTFIGIEKRVHVHAVPGRPCIRRGRRRVAHSAAFEVIRRRQ